MKLHKLIGDIYDGRIEPAFEQKDIFFVSCDSRKITLGSFFVALKGLSCDGEHFIEEAIAKGASAVATSGDVETLQKKHASVCFLKVDDSQDFLKKVTRKFYGNPSEKVRVFGVTGTNGKTTATYLIESILKAAGKECGVIGTVNYRLAESIVPAQQTTPNFIDNQHFLTGLAWQRVPYCAIEVSSHALTQDRVHGIDFRVAVFTNLTSDHLDYHETKEDYFSAKASLFTELAPESAAVINKDDPHGQKLMTMTGAKIMTYGIESQADVTAKDIQLNMSGSCFTLVCSAGEIEIQTKLIGTHNVYNILSAASACLAEGVPLNVIRKGVEHLAAVPGRLERVECGQDFSVFIDYAHTQDALDNVLTSIRQAGGERIILVFGCGGDRDQFKRPLMGQTAGRLADLCIVTSDNPRSENPQSIIDQIIPGFERDNYKVVVNRKKAIKQALAEAKPGDIVLIAGKGHETYQIFSDKKIDFYERDIIEKCLQH